MLFRSGQGKIQFFVIIHPGPDMQYHSGKHSYSLAPFIHLYRFFRLNQNSGPFGTRILNSSFSSVRSK